MGDLNSYNIHVFWVLFRLGRLICLFSRGMVGLKLGLKKINITLRLPLAHLTREEN